MDADKIGIGGDEDEDTHAGTVTMQHPTMHLPSSDSGRPRASREKACEAQHNCTRTRLADLEQEGSDQSKRTFRPIASCQDRSRQKNGNTQEGRVGSGTLKRQDAFLHVGIANLQVCKVYMSSGWTAKGHHSATNSGNIASVRMLLFAMCEPCGDALCGLGGRYLQHPDAPARVRRFVLMTELLH